MTETDLLTQYATNRSDELFAEIVRRHADLVYGAATRQVRDPAMAADITQAVFILLSQRAAKVRGTLAGWLIVTTALTAKNAKKMAARRSKHERRAAQMKAIAATAEEPAEWASYAPVLDGALAGLPEADRDVLVARYLQNKPLREVGTIIGVSEEAARKRVDRALLRLRKRLRSHMPVPAAAVLGSHLDRFAVRSAPKELVDSIVQHGAAAKAGTAAAIAHHVRRASLLLKVKIACVVIAIVLAGGAAAKIIAGEKASPQAPVTVSTALPPPPPISTIDATEANHPGMLQVMSWDVLLNREGTNAIAKVGQNFATASKGYQAMLCDAGALRRAVVSGVDDGGVLAVAHDDRMMQTVPAGDASFNGYGYQLDFHFENNDRSPLFYGYSNDSKLGIDQIGLRRGRARFDYPNAWVAINDGQSDERQTRARITCDHEIVPGQSIAFLGRFTGGSGRPYGHLVVWEAFAATPREMAAISTPQDAGWWCRHGPDTLHAWAAQASEWSGSAGGRPMAAPSIERKLDDGESIWLWALTRPSQWPLCWWDPTGKPAGAYANAFPFDGDPPAKLIAQVGIVNAPHNLNQLQPEDWASSVVSYPIPDDARSFTVGVPIGPWKDVANLKPGQTITADGIAYSIKLLPNSVYELEVTGVLNDDFRPIPTGVDGKPVGDFGWSRTLKWEEETAPRTYLIQRPLENNAHAVSFLVQRRRRQFVTFSNFATAPQTPPPPIPSAAEADAAPQIIRTQALQQYFQQFANQRIGRAMQWFLGTPDDYMDANNIFLHAAVLGDEKTVRQMLEAKDPQVSSVLDDLSHIICQGQILRREAQQRFGEPAASKLLDQPGLFEDMIAELMSCGWGEGFNDGVPLVDGKSMELDMHAWDDRLEPLIWRMAGDHLFYLNVDDLAEWPDVSERLDQEKEKVDRLEAMLRRQPTVSIDEFRRSIADH